jgi:glycosyltransferase involved in cell wall biosynthesis
MDNYKTITVLMCVYNGERFLLEQLESLRNQTRQPEEVIIYDDCSTDSSINIINQYITNYNLSSYWKININKYRKGWRLNFYDAILECTGDFIFFCDHDDIWYSDKILIMSQAMHENPNILVLTGFLETIDANGNIINVMDWTSKNIYNRKIIKSNLGESIFDWKQRNGCTMAIQNIVKDQLKHFERNENFAHDVWALNIGSLLGGCYHLNHPVIQYRVHDNNTDNTASKRRAQRLNKKERILELTNKIKYLEYIHNGVKLFNIKLIDRCEYHVFLKAISFYKFKLDLINNFKLNNIFKLFLYINIYIKYISIKNFFIDILEIFRLFDQIRNIKYLFLKRNNYK